MKPLLHLLLPLALATVSATGHGAEPSIREPLQTLAASGNAEAAYHLGMMHHLGLNGAAKDAQKAFAYFTKAAEGGDPLGAYKLGCYYDGQGEGVVEDDPELALKYKLVAAEAGYALAQHDTALLYYRQQDVVSALRWLKAAADQGDAGSLMAYASIHNGGENIAKDPVKTFAYFTLALRARGEPVSKRQTEWLADFKAGMSEAEIAEANAIVASWKPRPTPLTFKALSGDKAAETLIRAVR